MTGGGILQSTAAVGQTPGATCPYPTDPDLPHGSVSTIQVNVVDVTTGAGSVFEIDEQGQPIATAD